MIDVIVNFKANACTLRGICTIRHCKMCIWILERIYSSNSINTMFINSEMNWISDRKNKQQLEFIEPANKTIEYPFEFDGDRKKSFQS